METTIAVIALGISHLAMVLMLRREQDRNMTLRKANIRLQAENLRMSAVLKLIRRGDPQ